MDSLGTVGQSFQGYRVNSIPEALRAERRWVVAWYPEGRPGYAPKCPFQASDPTQPANSTDPATWSDFTTAVAAAEAHPGQLILGFVLGGGFVGVDLDKCRDVQTGKLTPDTRHRIKQLDSYTEVSPSGTGIHVLTRGSLPAGGRKKGHVEMYDGAKYFTITGQHLEGTPLTIEDRTAALHALHREVWPETDAPVLQTELPGVPASQADEADDLALIERAMTEFRNSEKFARLWRGDTDGYPGWSEAIAAHLLQLAWLLGKDPARIDAAFRQSELYAASEAARPKWDERRGKSTWGQLEVQRAIRLTRETYHPGSQAIPAVKPRGTFTLTFAGPPVPGRIGDYVLLPKANDFDGWWPRGRVHVVGGSSGTGKSTLTLMALLDQRDRKPVLGHVGAGLPFILITVDRCRLSNLETLKRLRLREQDVPLRPITDSVFDDEAVQTILDIIEAEPELPAVVGIEGLDFLVEQGNKMASVGRFLHHLQTIAEHYHLSIIGTVGSPKTKTDSNYQQTRDMLLGSSGWGRKADDVAVLTFSDAANENGSRVLTMAHRNSSAERFTLDFEGGRLVEVQEDQTPPDVTDESSAAARVLAFAKARGTFRVGDLKDLRPAISGARRKEILAAFVRSGVLTMAYNGTYTYEGTENGTGLAGGTV